MPFGSWQRGCEVCPMPAKPLHPCAEPGCPTLVRDGARCPQHEAEYRRRQDARRPRTAARGYGNSWQKASEKARKDHPYCAICGSTEDLTTHHGVLAREGGTAEDGTAVICRACHNKVHKRKGVSRG